MKQYQDLLQDVLQNGKWEKNRTNVITKAVFCRMMRFDASEKFNLLTCKKMATKAVIGELLWFLSGSSDIRDLRHFTDLSETDFCIWQQNLEEYNKRIDFAGQDKNPNDLGYVYSQVWRHAYIDEETRYDQIGQLIEDLKKVKEDHTDPSARRLIVMTWDPVYHTNKLNCALPPCHFGFQCHIRGNKLSLVWFQRSVDSGIGLPFNIASYDTLLKILAKLSGLEPDELVFFGTNVHIYENHIEQCKEMISRPVHEQPTLKLPEFDTLEELLTYTAKDFVVEGYTSEPAIKMKMS